MVSLPSKKQIALIVHDMQNDYLKLGGKFVAARGMAPATGQCLVTETSAT